MTLVVKNPPTNAGDIKEVDLIPGSEDPLEEGMATHSMKNPHGQRSLVGCHLWGCTESDMTEAT